MVKRGGGVVDIRPRIVPYDRSRYVDSVDMDEYVSKHGRIDLDELVTKFDKSRVFPAGCVLHWNREPFHLYTVWLISSSSIHHRTNPPREEPCTENKKDNMLIVHIYIDVCESMGANLVTTVAEGLSPKIVEISGGRAVVRIVSNLVDERRAKATFLLPVNMLKYKGMDGLNVAKGILEAFALASEDQYRAATHNKGIMNGIDAAALALGQDSRAIEAAAHAWAARSGRYRPLTSYKLVKDAKNGKMFLFGSCEMPVAIGVRGGAIQAHPVMAYTHGLVGNPTSRQLGEVLVCVGLAQNFAALRAIVSEGIQRGHMSLHSRTIAIGAGAPPHLVQEVSNYMISVNKIDQETAADYLRAHSILANSTQHRFFKAQRQTSPSTLFVELELQGVRVNLNIVFETIGGDPVQLALREDVSTVVATNGHANGNGNSNGNHAAKDDEQAPPPPIQKDLFGEKSPAWFKRMFDMLNSIRVSGKPQQRTHHIQQNKLKLISILMNVLIYRLVKLHPDDTSDFLERVLSAELNPLSKISEEKPSAVRVGFSLLLALWQVFKHQVDAIVSVPSLANALKEEQLRIFSALFRTPEVYKSAKSLDRFMATHSKRFQSSMFLLCDLYGLPDNLITPERLFLIFKLGQYFEWEGIVAHDVARWERDLAEDAPNVYSFWLRTSNLKPDSANLQKFLGEIDKQLQSKKRKLLEAKVPVDVMDARKVLDATKILRQHYGLAKDASSAINKIPNQSKL